MEEERQNAIHSKGFDMGNLTFVNHSDESVVDYNKIKVGVKSLDDAVLTLGDISRNNKGINKGTVLKALGENNIPEIRRISEYFYNTSGIYMRVCNYFAQLYRYDWYIVPEVNDKATSEDKIIKEYKRLLNYLDKSYIKKLSGDIALKVVKYGCYYGYLVPSDDCIIIQELPAKYCRSRYSVAGVPAIEFNMAFFDEKFSDANYRQKILKMFPEEFSKGYKLYKQGKLGEDDWNYLTEGNDQRNFEDRFNSNSKAGGWYLLDPEAAIKFNLNGSDVPIFAASIPSIIDLDAAQDLDRRKQMQQLLKILIQKLPLDKNGDLIFDVDEARDIHNNAVQMLKRAVGVDILTTFADVESINLSDKNTTSTQDDLAKVERTVYNSLGTSRDLFNSEGNISLNKSILDDEATMRNFLFQLVICFDKILSKKNTNKKKFQFKFYMLETTTYNYQELSKLFKEQAQTGSSKLLSQIALGLSQSSILDSAHFENQVLHLSEIMLPPLMSSTMSSQDLLDIKAQSKGSNNQGNTGDNIGRPEKPEDEKSDKTLQNIESMS